MRIALASDAWHPQVNGVVRALSTTVDHLRRRGHQVTVIEPSAFRTIPCPSYPEIRLALGCAGKVARLLDAADADAVHIATEGPIGWAARNWCVQRRRRFTTSFHTRFPDYVSMRSGLPASWGWAVMRRFHAPAERTFVVTRRLGEELRARGVGPVHLWPLGVGLDQFRPDASPHPAMADLPRPILLNVGRIAVEKNIEAFLRLAIPASKVVVGGGPALTKLKARYPEVLFLGPRHGAELASAYAAADVFVCSQAGPTPSGWSTSRRSPADCRLRHSRSRVRWTSSGRTGRAFTAAPNGSVPSMTISSPLFALHWVPTASPRPPKRSTIAGNAAPTDSWKDWRPIE